MTANAAARQPSEIMDVDVFMAFYHSRPRGERWDLVDGVAVLMTPTTWAHQRIAYNLCTLLNAALEASGLDLQALPNLGTRIAGLRDFQAEPDAVVMPGIAGYECFQERFRLAAEVVSPSNTRKHIARKLRLNREAPENLYVLIIEQRRIGPTIHARSRGWEPLTVERADKTIELPEFGFRCRAGDLYKGTPLGVPS